jgi:hypothetical protein
VHHRSACGKRQWIDAGKKISAFPAFAERFALRSRASGPDITYVDICVELDDGPQCCSHVTDCSIEQVTINVAVELRRHRPRRDNAKTSLLTLSLGSRGVGTQLSCLREIPLFESCLWRSFFVSPRQLRSSLSLLSKKSQEQFSHASAIE